MADVTLSLGLDSGLIVRSREAAGDWACDKETLTCTCVAALEGPRTFPLVTLRVDVAPDASVARYPTMAPAPGSDAAAGRSSA